jgi:hypothetical protein
MEQEQDPIGSTDLEADDDDDEDGAGAADTSRLNAMFAKAPEGEGAAAYEKLEARINRE